MGMRIIELFKNKKSRIAIIAALVVIAAAGAVYLIFGGKSARDFYLDAEGKNFQQYAQFIKKTYTDYKALRQPYLSGNYKSRTEITLNAEENDSQASNGAVDGVMDVLGKCKLVVDSQSNNAEKSNLTKLSLLLEKTPFLDAEIFSKNRQLYFTVPVFTPDKYFKLDTGRLNEVYDRFSLPVKPLRVPSFVDAADAVEMDVDEFDALTREYGSYISRSIKNDDVKYGKWVDMTISGQKTRGREVSVNLDKENFTALLKGLSAKAAEDDVFALLTYGNFAAVSEIADEAGIFRLFDFLNETGTVALNDTEKEILKAVNVKRDTESFKKELAELFNGCDFTNGIQMDLIIDKSGNILKRKAVVSMKDTANGIEYELNINTGTNSLKYNDYRNRYAELDLSTKSGGESGNRQYFRFYPLFEPASKDGGNKGNIGISWGIDTDSGIHSSTTVRLNIDSSTDELTSRENSTVAYNIEMEGNNEGQPEKLTGEIKTVKWKNNKLKTRNQTTAVSINADLPDFGVTDFSAVLNLAREDKLDTGSFELPEVVPANVVDLNAATDEELNKVWEEILGSFGTFYMTNKPIMDAVLGDG